MYDIYVDEDIEIRAEVDEFTQVLLHMEVFNWNKSVARKAKMLSTDTLEALRLEGFTIAYTITPNPKFVKLICGGELISSLTHDNIKYEVITWDLC
jgi:hypothetical protein